MKSPRKASGKPPAKNGATDARREGRAGSPLPAATPNTRREGRAGSPPPAATPNERREGRAGSPLPAATPNERREGRAGSPLPAATPNETPEGRACSPLPAAAPNERREGRAGSPLPAATPNERREGRAGSPLPAATPNERREGRAGSPLPAATPNTRREGRAGSPLPAAARTECAPYQPGPPHEPGNIGNSGDDKPKPGTRDWLLALALVSAILLAFLPVWRAGFIWDDDVYVTDNPLLTASDGLRRIWFSLDSPSQYFPLTYTTFYLERLLWGFHPAGYHAVNLLLHAANALLVWRLLARLRVPGAWLAAALFALHPVQVESVAWITERKNVLMGFFFLLSLLAWTRFLEQSSQSPWRPGVREVGAKR